jgi:hypothetical protein
VGNANTANGFAALFSNTIGDSNNATGYTALTTAIGDTPGAMITGSGNVCIGEGAQGVAPWTIRPGSATFTIPSVCISHRRLL